jgi:hypothetical protein
MEMEKELERRMRNIYIYKNMRRRADCAVVDAVPIQSTL